MSDNQTFKGDGVPSHFAAIPHMADDLLNIYEYRLLGHYIRRAGEKNKCDETITTTAIHTNMSEHKVRAARKSLEEKGFIHTENHGSTVIIAITISWNKNREYCSHVLPIEQVYEVQTGKRFEDRSEVGRKGLEQARANKEEAENRAYNSVSPYNIVAPDLTELYDKEEPKEEPYKDISSSDLETRQTPDNPSSFSTTKKGSSKKQKTTHTGAPTAQQRYWGISQAVLETEHDTPTPEQIKTRLSLAKQIEHELGRETTGDELREAFTWKRSQVSDSQYLPKTAAKIAGMVADYKKHESEQEDYLYDIYMNARQEQARQER